LFVCNNLWEHVADPLNLLSEISRITKARGKLCISTPSRYRLHNLVAALRGRPIEFMSEHHVTEYTVGQVKEQLAFGGYKLLKCYSEPITIDR